MAMDGSRQERPRYGHEHELAGRHELRGRSAPEGAHGPSSQVECTQQPFVRAVRHGREEDGLAIREEGRKDRRHRRIANRNAFRLAFHHSR